MLSVMASSPSSRARELARALHALPSVREVSWTQEGAREHLWVLVASWADVDFFPAMDAQDRIDPDGSITLHVHAVGDMTIARTPVRPPAHAMPL
jgi:hypothetical protein